MKSPSFEIKIAFCGYVNAGKSTLVNALLQQKYTEVSMNRTTLGVNSFRVFLNKGEKDVEEFETLSSKSTEESETGAATTWSVGPEKLQSSEETHRIIAQANADAREMNEIKETTFDIEVREAICDMRDDTQLVVVDLPGFTDVTNEEDVHVKYLNAKWDSYDCVVVVLDVMETIGKQVDLLKLVKENLKDEKDIPVIFVCNKVDNPDSSEVGTKLKELERTINGFFEKNVSIKLCSKDAMMYRSMSNASFEQFQLFDMEWVNKVGIDEFGRSTWRKFSQKEKFEAAFKTMSDKSVYNEILATSGFPQFLVALIESVGDSKAQLELIQKQLSVALKAVRTFDNTTVETIFKIKNIGERLGIATEMTFQDHFWKTYKNYVSCATETYKLTTDHKMFHVAMTQLIAYDAELGRNDLYEMEHRKVVDEMIFLVRLQLLELLNYSESWHTRYTDQASITNGLIYFNEKWISIYGDSSSYYVKGLNLDSPRNKPPKNNAHHWNRVDLDTWINKYTNKIQQSKYNPVTKQEDWYDLSLRDFEIAFASILLVSSCKPFWSHFGQEKIRMESMMRQFDCLRAFFNDPNGNSECGALFKSIAGKYNAFGKFVPTDLERFNVFVHFEIPDQISDTKHWGHLAWMFCEFMEKSSQNAL